ncbi:MAG: hypothetical protein ACFFAK_04930 [Promethearchaeota archaeon]
MVMDRGHYNHECKPSLVLCQGLSSYILQILVGILPRREYHP